MNSYFATRFSRYNRRGDGFLVKSRWGCCIIPVLCRASRLAKILTSRTRINPVSSRRSVFLPASDKPYCLRPMENVASPRGFLSLCIQHFEWRVVESKHVCTSRVLLLLSPCLRLGPQLSWAKLETKRK